MRQIERTYSMEELSPRTMFGLARDLTEANFRYAPTESGIIRDKYGHEVGNQEGLTISVDCRTKEGKRLDQFIENYNV